MTNNSNRLIFYIILFMGMILLPFFGFSQQEEPKRVNIIVNIKEIRAEKEIIQLPATNLPVMIKAALHKLYAKTVSPPIKKTNEPVRSIVKENVVRKNQNIAEAKTKPTTKEPSVTAEPTPSKRVETVEKPTVIVSAAVPKNSIQKDAGSNIRPNSTTPQTNVGKEVKKIEEETTASIKLSKDTSEMLKVTNGTKVSSFSYIWIGIFLVLAGIVLGLLFGKPAFLVSFVGVVFITLGLIIRST